MVTDQRYRKRFRAINGLIFSLFVAFISFAYTWTNHPNKRIGCTELNGDGCVCHNLDRTTDVKVWVQGPLQLETGETGIYKMFLAGGPAMAGGERMAGAYNIAARYGTLAIMDTVSVLFWGEITQRIPLMFNQVTDTLFWEFAYTAPDSACMDTIYSTGLSFILEGLPDTDDYWNFGPKFPVRIVPKAVPVELTSFSVSTQQGYNLLQWTTSSEMNNQGFEIMRNSDYGSDADNWETVGFVAGKGTSTEQNSYEFTDNHPAPINAAYKLKQIDLDGSYNFSGVIVAEAGSINENGFFIKGAYPNPFNPSAIVSLQIGKDSEIKAELYSFTGEKVRDIFEGNLPSGNHLLKVDGEGLPSGMYLLRVANNQSAAVYKMILAK
ncbi:MAG: hypothetical protein FMNOHCHN_03677 [Ignavibacteriaceae bacterium]|nr:hypothetical protein [Ignavibacteriaceae bacterium]